MPALLLMVAMNGCASSIDVRKQDSMARFGSQLVSGVPAPAFAESHVAALFTGADDVEHLAITPRGVHGVFRLNGQICRTIGGCAAVPIDPRGYWLTAGHCADSGGALLYDPSPASDDRVIPVRFVWHSEAPGEDLAILFAPLPLDISPVDVAPTVRVGQPVVCVGGGITSPPLSAGHVVGVGGSTNGSLKWLEHDAPLTAGDSGGPAFYLDGLLAGINVEAGRTRTGTKFRATALVPDMQAIIARIDADWTSNAPSR